MKVEVLWYSEETADVLPQLILSDGSVLAKDGAEWSPCDDPMARELARRLLKEREEQKALDDYNDEREAAEKEADAVGLSISGVLSRVELDEQGIDEHGDARPDFFDALQEVFNLWGPKGTLREKLCCVRSPGYINSMWFQQLRSELLALPDWVKP